MRKDDTAQSRECNKFISHCMYSEAWFHRRFGSKDVFMVAGSLFGIRPLASLGLWCSFPGSWWAIVTLLFLRAVVLSFWIWWQLFLQMISGRCCRRSHKLQMLRRPYRHCNLSKVLPLRYRFQLVTTSKKLVEWLDNPTLLDQRIMKVILASGRIFAWFESLVVSGKFWIWSGLA